MRREKHILGWREWVSLPELGVDCIKAKVDTGARTSALHAEAVRRVRRGAKRLVRFVVCPKQRSRKGAIEVVAPFVEERRVRSSNGTMELRPVILTTLDVEGDAWPIELTLTHRDLMGFRMLLGRQALRGHAVVDPARSFTTRKRRPASGRGLWLPAEAVPARRRRTKRP